MSEAAITATILTIGHSNHPFERLVDLLTSHGVEVLVDVRSQPYSKFAPQFSKPQLENLIKSSAVRYLYLGRELGGKPNQREFYDEAGHARYDRIAESPDFLNGIARVRRGAESYRLALMCSEEDPTDCHRRRLVRRVLALPCRVHA